jgi:hypothetical protein
MKRRLDPMIEGQRKEVSMDARTNRQACAVVHMKKKSRYIDLSEVSLIQAEVVAEITPTQKSDSAEMKVVCEGGVCEVTWHPDRKAA